jgi:hypothetical protein
MDKAQIKKLVEIILNKDTVEMFEIKAENPKAKTQLLVKAIQIVEQMKAQKLDFEQVWQENEA